MRHRARTDHANPHSEFVLSLNQHGNESPCHLFYETVVRPADADVQSEFAKHGRLRRERAIGLFRTGRVCHLNVIGLVTRHHLIAADAIGDRVHDGPLRCRDLPAALGLLARQLANGGAAQIGLERAMIDEHPAPHDFARLADAFHYPSAKAEVHGRLTLAHDAGISIDEMPGRCGAADLEYPDELAVVILAVTKIVKRGFGIEPQLGPDAI